MTATVTKLKKKPDLQIEYMAVSDLIPYPNNAKIHPKEQIQRIAGSIKEFGFVVPVLLDKDNGVIAGHGRIEAAQVLKLEAIPCCHIDNLTPAQVRALRVAENQLTMSSGWDYEMLGLELDGLKELDFDLDVLGFEDLGFMDDQRKESNSFDIQESYEIVITDLNEDAQGELLQRLTNEGYKCRALVS